MATATSLPQPTIWQIVEHEWLDAHKFWVSVVGPLSSLAVALGAYLAYQVAPGGLIGLADRAGLLAQLRRPERHAAGLRQSLLGMSFLTRLKRYEVANGRMILED